MVINDHASSNFFEDRWLIRILKIYDDQQVLQNVANFYRYFSYNSTFFYKKSAITKIAVLISTNPLYPLTQ